MYYLVILALGYGEDAEVEEVEILYSEKPFNKTDLDSKYMGWRYLYDRPNLTRREQATVYKKRKLSFSTWLRKYKGFKKVRDNRIQFIT